MSLATVNRKIPNNFAIKHFLECRACAESVPAGVTYQEWADVQVGLTSYGVQVWCNRHAVNIIHFDFRNSRVQVNATKENEIVWRNTQ